MRALRRCSYLPPFGAIAGTVARTRAGGGKTERASERVAARRSNDYCCARGVPSTSVTLSLSLSRRKSLYSRLYSAIYILSSALARAFVYVACACIYNRECGSGNCFFFHLILCVNCVCVVECRVCAFYSGKCGKERRRRRLLRKLLLMKRRCCGKCSVHKYYPRGLFARRRGLGGRGGV